MLGEDRSSSSLESDNQESPRSLMAERWSKLALEIASEPRPSESHHAPKGSLTVIGSGISHIDLLRDAEDEILQADVVFHCINDRVTQVWVSSLRPDAFDLRILYDDALPRHFTYLRMAEALCFHVRRGKKVLAIFYGHPGIFASPAHRAIAILKAEGHRAKMRPGISALDHLVADLGFDPALPGLITFEATDMLLHRRRIDPSLHTVIWQVGVVGEFSFKPTGFENKGYGILIDELTEVYGPDCAVTHYISPQYVGVEPLIEKIPLCKALDDLHRKNISPLSTFYIAPHEAKAMDLSRGLNLGFLDDGQNVPDPRRDHVNTSYGPVEDQAIRGLKDFSVPPYYYLEERSPASNFMLSISNNAELRQLWVTEPERVLSLPEFSDLNERARRLLTMHHPLAIGAALSEPSR